MDGPRTAAPGPAPARAGTVGAVSVPDHRPIRIGNEDRERAVRALGEHFADGRLDPVEFEERITAVYAARTLDDLEPLFHDLPRAGSALAPPPPAAPPYPAHPDQAAPYGRELTTGRSYSDKSKVVAGVLQLVLGWVGAGRFYTGHTKLAVAQLVVTFVTFGLGGIWGFVDGIVLLAGRPTDPSGRPLRP